MSFKCKKLLCVLLTAFTLLAMTSVVALAENESVADVSEDISLNDSALGEVSAEVSTEVSTAEDVSTIFPILENEDVSHSSILERLTHGGKVTLVGMLVVFAVLIVLMIILYIFSAVFGKKKDVKSDAPAVQAAPAVSAAPAVAANGEEAIVAVATAAIAAARGESDCAFKVISITQIN